MSWDSKLCARTHPPCLLEWKSVKNKAKMALEYVVDGMCQFKLAARFTVKPAPEPCFTVRIRF